MTIFIIPESGALDSQGFQFISLKRGTIVKLVFMFYKDAGHAEAWNLAALDAFSIVAKERLDQNSYDIEYVMGASNLDFTNAADGVVAVTIPVTENMPQSMYAEIAFQIYGATQVYKTPSFILEVVEGMEII